MEKISIIIPVYNKEKYLKRCLESVINQTYKNIEIIIVNDGSTDNSKEVLEEFASKDSRINLINTENRGAGSARNTGLDATTSDYISFIDADDCITLDYIESLYNALNEYDADIAECHYMNINPKDEFLTFYNKHEFTPISNLDKLKKLYGEDPYEYVNSVIMPNKLFRKKLFKNNKYPVGRLIDDEFIIYKLYVESEKIVETKDVMYAYIQSEKSVMRKDFKEKRVHDTVDVYEEVYNFFKDYEDKELVKLILKKYLFYCDELIEKTMNSKAITPENKEVMYDLINSRYERNVKAFSELLNDNEKDEYFDNIVESYKRKYAKARR